MSKKCELMSLKCAQFSIVLNQHHRHPTQNAHHDGDIIDDDEDWENNVKTEKFNSFWLSNTQMYIKYEIVAVSRVFLLLTLCVCTDRFCICERTCIYTGWTSINVWCKPTFVGTRFNSTLQSPNHRLCACVCVCVWVRMSFVHSVWAELGSGQTIITKKNLPGDFLHF